MKKYKNILNQSLKSIKIDLYYVFTGKVRD